MYSDFFRIVSSAIIASNRCCSLATVNADTNPNISHVGNINVIVLWGNIYERILVLALIMLSTHMCDCVIFIFIYYFLGSALI